MEAKFMTQEMISAKACPNYIKLKFQQAKRRQDILKIQKQKREEQTNERRYLENYTGCNWMEMYEENNRITIRNETYELGLSLMSSEYMFEVPEDIDNWIAVLCPDGKRCCVISQNNKTKVVNKYGTTLNYFQSLFPHGCTISNNYSSNRKRTVLDCIYSYKLKKYYILDIIEWIGVPYTDFDADYRFYFIRNKLREIPGINETSEKNYYPFELAPRMVAHELYPLLLENFQFFPKNVYLDGINFYYSESLYIPGNTPLVLWLNPFMIPEVLGKQVNDQLAQKPLDYVNIFEYCQQLKKKKRNTKKRRKNLQSEQMEIDNLTEVEKYNDPAIESEMNIEN